MISWLWLIPAFVVGGILLFVPILWLLGWMTQDGMREEGYPKERKV